MSESDPRFEAFALLLQLEREARHAPDEPALRFITVNRTRSLLEYRQALLVRRGIDGRRRVVAISGVPNVDRNTPFVQWAERLVRQFPQQMDNTGAPRAVTAAEVEAREAGEWPEWSAPHGLWCPLRHGDGDEVGGLWLTREQPWSEAEQLLAGHLADAYGHAWHALECKHARRRLPRPSRRALIVTATLAALLLLFPVRQTTLAPAEVVPHDPVVVAAPIKGVIHDFTVKPNQPVKQGQVLFHFDDTEFEANYQVAQKSLSVAQAEYLQATQGAFNDPKSSARTGILRARIQLRTAERDYAQTQLNRTVVTAQRSGIAVYADPDDWLGKPVVVGERIMQLANPADTQLRIDLPVAGAITLPPGAKVVLFLDTDPLHPLHAVVTRAGYEAEPTDSNILAYRLYARFDKGTVPPRIGLQGTAKLYGSRVVLGYYLLRRPISTLRRWLGL